jgi:hypothetical protein
MGHCDMSRQAGGRIDREQMLSVGPALGERRQVGHHPFTEVAVDQSISSAAQREQ